MSVATILRAHSHRAGLAADDGLTPAASPGGRAHRHPPHPRTSSPPEPEETRTDQAQDRVTIAGILSQAPGSTEAGGSGVELCAGPIHGETEGSNFDKSEPGTGMTSAETIDQRGTSLNGDASPAQARRLYVGENGASPWQCPCPSGPVSILPELPPPPTTTSTPPPHPRASALCGHCSHLFSACD